VIKELNLPNSLKIKSGKIPHHLIDMDGVLVRGSNVIEGSVEYLNLLVKQEVPFLVFSNNSRCTPKVMAKNLRALGFQVTSDNIYTAAMTTAHFIKQQKPKASYYSIGDTGISSALEDVGCVYNDLAPDYVVVGESLEHSYAQITKGSQLVAQGARFIGTNPDLSIPAEEGDIPGCGSICALIEAATGRQPYFLGKPNPFMMRSALDKLGVTASNAVMVGDRIDTDVLSGMELGLQTVLVLTGASRRESIDAFPYNPGLILPRLLDLREHMGLV
jgi:NagD protein